MKRRELFMSIIIFAVSLAVFSLDRLQLVSLKSTDRRQTRCLAGDEPSYLLLTHSLVMDGDFNLYNNGLDRDSRYFGLEHCGGHIARKDTANREAYSIHMPGLSMLLAPAYALALRSANSPRGMVCVFMNILAALLAVQLYLFCGDLCRDGVAGTRNPSPLIPATIAVMFTPPVIFYSNLAYPELPGALLILYALRYSTNPASADSFVRRFAVSAAIAFLPWLSFRFLPAALVLLLMFLLPRRGKGGAGGTAAAVVFMLSIFLILLYQRHAFGTFNIAAGYHCQDFEHRGAGGAGGANGIPGLLLDQAHGLIPWSPVYLLSFTGLALLLRERRVKGLQICVLIAALYLPAATFVHWWGGFSPPPRFLVAVSPLLGGALCYALFRIKRVSFEVLFAILLASGLGLAYLGCANPVRLYRHEHILAGLYPRQFNLVFPKLVHTYRSTVPLLVIWILVITLVTVYYSRAAVCRDGIAGRAGADR